MTRTTVALDDRLLEEIRLRAAEQGRSMSQVVNDLLRLGLRSAAAEPPEGSSVPWRTFRCGEVLVDVSDREALYAALED
ncbi:MAG: hypothetical protein AMXMBFR64_42040 [Myxococcales bacterium]